MGDVQVKNVSKGFLGSDSPVLENISLEIKSGEFVCLLGASGCGKSTLLNLIAGLDVPTSGNVFIDGKPVEKPGVDRSYIFQEPALFPWLNVLDNVKFGMKINGVGKEEQEKKASYFLKMVKLEKYEKYRIHELSGGMKQRVALARALTLDSDILLMDEPFAALDSHTKSEMRINLLDIWGKTSKTIVFVTHSIEEAFLLADRIIVLSSHPTRIIKEYSLERPRNLYSLKISTLMAEAENYLAKGGGIVAS